MSDESGLSEHPFPTHKFTIEFKDPDVVGELIKILDTDADLLVRTFKWLEYGCIEIEVDKYLNIINARFVQS